MNLKIRREWIEQASFRGITDVIGGKQVSRRYTDSFAGDFLMRIPQCGM